MTYNTDEMSGQLNAVPLRDGHFLIQNWRYLNNPSPRGSASPIVQALTVMLLILLVPLLVWGEDIEIPVLKHRVTQGEIVQADDIELRAMDEKKVHPRILRRVEELVGKEATRSLRAGIPLFVGHVRVPPTVSKNTLVTLIFQAPGLQLTGQGKALQDGPVGETVRVLNMESGKVVAGLVQPDGKVIIQ